MNLAEARRGFIADIDDDDLNEALHHAAGAGNVERIKYLIERKADPNYENSNGENILSIAIKRNRLEIVQLLVANGADVKLHQGRCIHHAAMLGSREIVKFLIEKGADVNHQDMKYGTALQVAAATTVGPDLELLRFLVDNGADVNLQGRQYGTALQGAIVGAEITRDSRFMVTTPATVQQRLLETLNFLIDKGADVNLQGGQYGTALQAAASVGNLEVVKFLFNKGADVNLQGGQYGTALQAVAATAGPDLELLRFLINKGADVNLQGGQYGTALQAAAWYSQETVKLLIDNGADVNLQGGLYGTALQVAAYLGALDIARLLVDNGAEPNLQGGRFDTALQAAAWAGSLETVKFLFNKGADVNLQGGECGTALQAAVMRRNLEVTEFLIENGADLDHKDAFQVTALHHAVRTRNVEIVKLLLDRNACPDTRDHAGITPFEAAIDVQNKEIILMLLSRTKPRPLLSAKRWRNALNCKRRRCLKFTFDEVLFIEEIERPRGRDKTERLMGVGATFLTDKLYYSRRIDFPKAAIYVVLNSGMLEVTPSSCFEYQWWRNRLLGESEPWSKTSSSLPSLDLCKQLDRNNFFVECWFTISCLTITEDNWPLPQSSIPEEYNDLKRIEGFYWATIRWPSENSSPDTPIEDLLRPIFSSTTCEDSVVDLVKGIGDLLIPLIDKFDHTFEDNVYWANRQLSSSRREVLKNGGSNPDLIHHLLSDATVIEHISGDYARIIQSLKKLIGHVRGLQKGPWKLSGESLYESKKKLEVLQRHRDAWRELSEKAQSLIGLEFNLASILEARRSTSTNRSLKRLTWVTFVFLPLLFVSSLFGMNVDILSHDPSWWYYFPIAGGFLFFTFTVWIFFKRYDTLEGSLEKHFAWLVKRHEKNGHGKEQADTGHSWLNGGKLKLRKLELRKLELRNLGLGKLGLRKRRERSPESGNIDF